MPDFTITRRAAVTAAAASAALGANAAVAQTQARNRTSTTSQKWIFRNPQVTVRLVRVIGDPFTRHIPRCRRRGRALGLPRFSGFHTLVERDIVPLMMAALEQRIAIRRLRG